VPRTTTARDQAMTNRIEAQCDRGPQGHLIEVAFDEDVDQIDIAETRTREVPGVWSCFVASPWEVSCECGGTALDGAVADGKPVRTDPYRELARRRRCVSRLSWLPRTDCCTPSGTLITARNDRASTTPHWPCAIGSEGLPDSGHLDGADRKRRRPRPGSQTRT
jgi:hypothetical protein